MNNKRFMEDYSERGMRLNQLLYQPELWYYEIVQVSVWLDELVFGEQGDEYFRKALCPIKDTFFKILFSGLTSLTLDYIQYKCHFGTGKNNLPKQH